MSTMNVGLRVSRNGTLGRDKMQRFKLSIDSDIDFGVVAKAEAFGYETVAGFRFRKKRICQSGSEPKLSIALQDDPEIVSKDVSFGAFDDGS